MDSTVEEDVTLPLDFNRTSMFPNFPVSDKRVRRQLSSPGNLTRENNSSSPYEPEARPKSATLEKSSPDRNSLKNHENVIGVLKKENFGLKLRIYFLEEQLQYTYKEDTDGVLKRNIELKVTIEQLKNEIVEKQELLVKASKAIETITSDSELRVRKLEAEFSGRFDILEKELAAKENELQENRGTMALNATPDASASAGIAQVTTQLQLKIQQHEAKCQDYDILKASSAKTEESLKTMITQLESSLKEKEEEDEALKSNIQSGNVENIAKVNLLSDKLTAATAELENLHLKLADKDKEISKASQFTDDLHKKLGLMQVDFFESKQKTLNSLKVITQKDVELSRLKGDIKSRDLSVSKLTAVNHSKDKEIKFLSDQKEKMVREFEMALCTKDKELEEAKAEAKTEATESNSRLTDLTRELQDLRKKMQTGLAKKDSIINQMASSLTEKDGFIEDLVIFSDSTLNEDPICEDGRRRSSQLFKSMQSKLQEQENQLQNHGHEKRQSLVSKDMEIASLKEMIDDLKRELEHAQMQASEYAMSKKHFEDVIHQKDAHLKEMTEALASQDSLQKANHAVLENDICQKEVLIAKLSDLVAKKDKELKDLQDSILSQGIEQETTNTSLKDTLELVQKQLIEREKMLRALSLERDAAAAQNERNRQKFISFLQDKDRQLIEEREKRQKACSDAASSLMKLSALISEKDKKIEALRFELETNTTTCRSERDILMAAMEEKDVAIENLARMGCEKDKMLAELKMTNDNSWSRTPNSTNQCTIRLRKDASPENGNKTEVNGDHVLEDGTQQTKAGNESQSSLRLDLSADQRAALQQDGLTLAQLLDLLKGDGRNVAFGSLEEELETIKTLKRELEESFLKNENLRKQLEEEAGRVFVNAQESTTPFHDEVQILKQRLEESEKWNTSQAAQLRIIKADEQTDLKQQMLLHAKENEELRSKVNRYDAEAQEINKRLLALRQEYEMRRENSEAERFELLEQLKISDIRSEALQQEVVMLKEFVAEGNHAKNDVLAIKGELQRSKQDATKAYKRIDTLTDDLANHKHLLRENTLLRDDVDQLKILNERLRQRLHDATNEALSSSNESGSSVVKLTNCLEELDATRHRLSLYEKELEQLKTKLVEYQNEAEKVKQLSEEVVNFQKENQLLQERLTNVISNAALENEREVGEICLLEDEVKYLRTVNENLALSLKAANGNNANVKAAQAAAEESNRAKTSMEKECIKLQEENKNLKAASESKGNEIVQCAAQEQRLNNQIKELIADSNRQDEERQRVEQHAVDLQESFGKLLADRNANSSMTSSRCQCSYFQDQLVDRDRQIQRLQQQLNIPANDKDSAVSGVGSESNLIEEHIAEMRTLRKQLEKSIQNNDALSAQLERRLAAVEQDSAKLADPSLRSSLIRDNDSLRAQLESQKLQMENVRVELQDKDCKLSSANVEVKSVLTKINTMTKEKERDKETIDLLHKEIKTINQMSETLKTEISVYDHLHQQLKSANCQQDCSTESKNDSGVFDASILQVLLNEIRNLRELLQKSMDSNALLRERLEQQVHLNIDPKSKDASSLIGLSKSDFIRLENCLSNCAGIAKLLTASKHLEGGSSSEVLDELTEVEQQLAVCIEIINIGHEVVGQDVDSSHRAIKDENKKLRQKIIDLTHKRSSQEQVIRSILQRLENQYKVKEGLEVQVTSELQRTRGMMQKAKRDLQVKVNKNENGTEHHGHPDER